MKQGLHLVADGYADAAGARVLGDRAQLEDILRRLVELLRMEILLGPLVCETPLDPDRLDVVDDSGGLTGVVVVTTSHVAFHTWPLEGRLSMDVYSCRSFDPAAVKAFLGRKFGIVRWVRATVIDRSVGASEGS